MQPYAFDPILCPRCHQPIAHINEGHLNSQMRRCAPKKLEAGAYVYLMHDTAQDLLKIGYTTNPARRFKEIRNANTNPVEFVGYIPGSKTNEAILHRRFAAYKFKLEWFHNDLAIYEYFQNHPKFISEPKPDIIP